MPDSNTDILIVGAGPIGLAHAWGLKKLNPKLKIKIVEQYPTYQRNHVLRMKHAPLEKLMRTTGSLQDPVLANLLARLKTNPFIRTSELQEAFQAVLKADDNPVEFIYRKIGSEFFPIDKILDENGAIDASKVLVDELYLSPAGRYVVRGLNGEIQEGLLQGTDINLSDLNSKLKDRAFKDLVLQQLAKRGHTKTDQQRVKEQLLAYKPKLIIGADGTHSTVSHALFPEGNQEKREFNYTLQMRYDVEGEVKPKSIASTIPFYQEIGRQGLIATESMGSVKDGKTPVTLQMVISKTAFNQLKSATSAKPILPFDKTQKRVEQGTEKPALTLADMPERIRNFLLRYWEHRLKSLAKEAGDHRIDPKSIKISVNETPATHAKQVFQLLEEDVSVVLVGDAALGLSFFKGLNGGIEADEYLLSLLKPVIQDWENQKPIQAALRRHEKWMLTVFGPKKINEVAHYSRWNIGAFQAGAQFSRVAKQFSKPEYEVEPLEFMKDYLDLLAQKPDQALDKEGPKYPHRKHGLIKTNQILDVPIAYSWMKIKKLFKDYVKPYKSYTQIGRDFRQPIFGISNTFIGLGKIQRGIRKLSSKEMGEGAFVLLRGLIEIITTPLAWVIKPIMRGIATAYQGGFSKIEDNSGSKKLVKLGLDKLEALPAEWEQDPNVQYQLKMLSTDIHRKFQKAARSGQPSVQPPMSEEANFNKMRDALDNPDKQQWIKELKSYFTLFVKEPKPVPPEKTSQPTRLKP